MLIPRFHRAATLPLERKTSVLKFPNERFAGAGKAYVNGNCIVRLVKRGMTVDGR
jgi:hypothetical protein